MKIDKHIDAKLFVSILHSNAAADRISSVERSARRGRNEASLLWIRMLELLPGGNFGTNVTLAANLHVTT